MSGRRVSTDGVYVVQGEMSIVVTCMRRNTRWSSNSPQTQDPLLQNFTKLKERLSTVQTLSELPVDVYLDPFLSVIRSEVTTGPIMTVVLSSIHKLLAYDLIDPAAPNAAKTAETIAENVAHAKFVCSDLPSYEVVLMKIITVLQELLRSSVGPCLSNESVCEIVQSCFRICFERNGTELLRRSAEGVLTEMVCVLFQRLQTLHKCSVLSSDDNMSILLSRETMQQSNPISAQFSSSNAHDDPLLPSDSIAAAESSGTLSESEPVPLEASEKARSQPTSPTAISKPSEFQGSISRAQTSSPVMASQQPVAQTPPMDHSANQVAYGVPCIRELFRFLISLVNPRDMSNTDPMIQMGLSLLTVALETSSAVLHNFSPIMELLEDELCRNLFRLLSSDGLPVFISALRVCFLIFEGQRAHLKYQLEYFLNIIINKTFESYEHREGALDCLLQLSRLPAFLPDIFVNFDCGLYSRNMFELLIKYLGHHAYPEERGLFTTNLLALDALLSVVQQTEAHISGNSQMKLSSSWTRPENLPTLEQTIANKNAKLLLIEGSKIFNENPKKGIAFFQEKNFLSEPLNIDVTAKFLRSNPLLSKAKLGEYIGTLKNVDILEGYVKSFDFREKNIDEALRSFLATFRLPGEAQIIERIVERLADHWHHTYQGERVVVDRDATFILLYAIILLNVDQHNPKNKRPMTLQDFIRNQRGLNNKKDFPRDFLESIYIAIKTREIVMPEEQEGDLKEDYEWKLLLQANREPGADLISTASVYDYDVPVFEAVWSSCVAALCFIFDTAIDESIVKKSLNALHSCTLVAAKFGIHEVIEKIVVALCNRSLLTTKPDPSESLNDHYENLVVAFGRSMKAQLATQMIFLISRDFGEQLRDSWKDVLNCIVQLYHCRLLPKPFLDLQDYVSVDGLCSILPTPKLAIAKSDSSLFSTFSSWLSSDAAGQKDAIKPDFMARSKAENCISQCDLANLSADSCLLSNDALQELCKTLITLCQASVDASDRVSVLLLEILCDISLRNKDRIHVWWEYVSELLVTLVNSSPSPFISERAVVNVLRIANRFIQREEFSQQMISVLKVLMNVNEHSTPKLIDQICAGLVPLIESNYAVIDSCNGWETVFHLLAKGKASQHSLASSMNITGLIVYQRISQDVLNERNFLACFRFLSETAVALKIPGHTVPETDGTKQLRPSVAILSSETSETTLKEVIELLHIMHTLAKQVCSHASGPYLWSSCWLPITLAISDLCLDARRPIRQAALTFVQRSLLLPDMEDSLSSANWLQVFELVLFPLLSELSLPARAGVDLGVIDETRMRACNMLTKVFLLHLNILSGDAGFAQLWLQILAHLERYLQLGELLAEAIPESLKNMLLVMSTSSVFEEDAGRRELLEQTWTRVHQFLPGLRASLFPEQSRQVTSAVLEPAAQETVVKNDSHPVPTTTATSEFTLGPPLILEDHRDDDATKDGGEQSLEGVELHPHPIIV